MSSLARYLTSTMVFTLSALLMSSGIAAAQEPPKATPPAAKAEGKKVEKITRHLPPYYKSVVSDEQRQQIYKIMAEYAPKISDLRARLADSPRSRTGRSRPC